MFGPIGGAVSNFLTTLVHTQFISLPTTTPRLELYAISVSLSLNLFSK
jgi:hypothetical protein